MKTLSFRFDIDSLADIEVGVPKLIRLAKELDIRFTFFVNMGRSFNWKPLGQGKRERDKKYSTIKKLGLMRTLRTLVLNPNVGLSHKKILFNLLDNGHELGLHGGMDHPKWQWGLDSLVKDEINDLLKPAYEHFTKLFGKTKGFASPGFRYNQYVLELIDDYGFEYASDMEGERPFRTDGLRHWQIPVNVIGLNRKPIIECLCGSGMREPEILARCREEIGIRDTAVMYGHPAFEGRFPGLRELISWGKGSGKLIMPMSEVNNLWQQI